MIRIDNITKSKEGKEMKNIEILLMIKVLRLKNIIMINIMIEMTTNIKEETNIITITIEIDKEKNKKKKKNYQKSHR